MRPGALQALTKLLRAADSKITGIGGLPEAGNRIRLDAEGLWWVAPFAVGASGCTYGLRLHPGSGDGAVVRCLNGHAVTIAADPSGAIAAILAVERLIEGPTFRERVQSAWPSVRPLLADATALLGGRPEKLDEALHAGDELASTKPAPPEEDAARRVVLGRILGDPGAADPSPTDPIWGRTRVGEANDAALLVGNHGLDGTRARGGLLPGPKGAIEVLTAAARRWVAAPTSTPWEKVIRAIAERGQPGPADFLPASVGVGPVKAWDALAAASFWFNAKTGRAPAEHAEAAAEIAVAAGAPQILDLREEST